MITNLLIRMFIKDRENTKDPLVRKRYAILAGVGGIILNVFLSVIKFVAGFFTGSLSMIADGFNNLSDSASSVVALLGVRMSGKHEDKKHPLGHGRYEYISAFIVDVIIIVVGVELFKFSVERILSPSTLTINASVFAVLGVAVLVKLWMFFFYRKIGKKINSQPLFAVGLDSISDVFATGLVIVSAAVSKNYGVYIDGYAGLIVAGFIIFSGFKAAKDTVELLLGASPDSELVEEIYDFIKGYPDVIGIHDLMVHDYGPGKQIFTFHAEVSSDSDLIHAHDVIDGLERDMERKFQSIVTIHLDPIAVSDEEVDKMRNFVEEAVREVDKPCTRRDFRMTTSENNLTGLFALTIPSDSKLSDDVAAKIVSEKISEKKPNIHTVIKAEHPFI